MRRYLHPAIVLTLTLLSVYGSMRQSTSIGQEFTITPDDKSYWAFQPSRRPIFSKTTNGAWPQSPLDHFILARLEAEGFTPVGRASRRELIRRVTFDLVGLPPTPEQTEAFVNNPSPHAFAQLVDRLLQSPRYGERWGRHWLDVARYAEDDLYGPEGVSQYQNAWRYRDWVIRALNQDMPYDLFVRAQIAGDLLDGPDGESLAVGTGFLALGVWYYASVEAPQARAEERYDRIDAITRGFLGLTVACARCHDHKYDPISHTDYYALDGIMASTIYWAHPLAPQDVVETYQQHKKKLRDQQDALKEFLDQQSIQISEQLARRTSRYLMTMWRLQQDPAVSASQGAQQHSLDQDILESWLKYLQTGERNHPFLQPWDNLRVSGGTQEQFQQAADRFQAIALNVLAEKKTIDKKNDVLLKAAQPEVDPEAALYLPNGFLVKENCGVLQVVLEPIERTKYILWLDLFGTTDLSSSFMKNDFGLYRLQGKTLERFLSEDSQRQLEKLRADLKTLQETSPPDYPFMHGMAESPRPKDGRILVRGNPYSVGEPTPRRFLAVLSQGQPARFTQGSGRRQLAESIAEHPLTARVIVNRIWQHHFGQGIVSTASNFGRLGGTATHPQLLEYLTHRLIHSGYSIKAIHREILLSATYQLSSRSPVSPPTERKKDSSLLTLQSEDPDNELLWRANRRRLDAEALRDAMLFVAGRLDSTVGGPSFDLSADDRRRTIYGRVSRSKLDHTLALFDFPDPSLSNSKRSVTNVPLQWLFFLNSDFVWREAGALAERIDNDEKASGTQVIQNAYRLLLGRTPSSSEVQLGLAYLADPTTRAAQDSPALQQYLQVLLSSNEFLYVD